MDQGAFQHLWLVLERNRPVAIHDHLIRLTGSTKAAVFLSQLVYWTRRSPSAQACGGWLHKTSAQWFRELGLSRREQNSARAILRALDVLEEALLGQPALRYYCLKLPQLGGLLSAHCGHPVADFDLQVLCTNEALVRELLGRALPYHRTLAYLTDSVNAALLLTRLIHQHRRHLHVEGWSRLSREELERELGLTRWEQETARERLRTRRLVEERMARLPARLYARVVPPVIVEALQRLEAERSQGVCRELGGRKGANQVIGNPAFLEEEKRQAGSRESHELACTKTSALLGAKPPPCLAENLPDSKRLTTGKLITEKLTTTTNCDPTRETGIATVPNGVVVAYATVPEPQATTSPTGELVVAGAASRLIFPADFLPPERELAAIELADLPVERAQAVLDELEGRTRKGRRVDSRTGLVRSLAKAEREGQFAPGYAWEVKANREGEAQRQARRQTAERLQAAAIQAAVGEERSGGTGYEAFKQLRSRWRGTGPSGSTPAGNSGESA